MSKHLSEQSWTECLQNGSVKEVKADLGKIQSIRNAAIGRTEFLDTITINQQNSNFVFEGFYASALELIHATALNKGFEVKNHVCLTFFLKEIHGEEKLSEQFDNCRRKRNNLVYYGKMMSEEVARKAILTLKEIIEVLKKS